MSVYQNRRIRVRWRVGLVKTIHRVIFGLGFFVIGSIVSTYAISNVSSPWVIGTIAVMNLGTLILVFGVEVKSVDITRNGFHVDFGSDDSDTD